MAIVPVPDGVVLSYNKFTFGPYIKTRLTETPILSGDRRVVKYSQIDIHASGWITQADADLVNADAGGTLDAAMRQIRLRLQANCKNLQYVNKGYGADLNINPPGNGGVRDVAMGPKAGKFTWWPLGGAPDGCHGAGFTWSISTAIPECLNAQFVPGAGIFSELWFSVSFETDTAGLLTIVTRGGAQIPLTLRSDNTLSANVDQYLLAVINPAPDGFLRHMSRDVSPDRANCTFTITDVQQEVPPPPKCVEISLKHKVRQTTIGDAKWDCSIAGTIRLDPSVSKIVALQTFYGIAFARIDAAAGPGGRGIIPPRLEMTEDLFKNSADFVISYMIVGANLLNIVQKSRLWTPVVNDPTRAAAGGNWSASLWSQSLAGTAQWTYGLLGMSFNPASEVVIDVCNQGTAPTQNPVAEGDEDVDDLVEHMEADDDGDDADDLEPIGLVTGNFSGRSANNGVNAGPSSDELSDYGESLFPDPSLTFVAWECDVQRLTDYRQIRHKPLSGDVTIQTPKIDPLGSAASVGADTSDPTPGWSATTPDIFQQISAPSMVIRLRGGGIRVAYRLNPPKLVSYGGVTPVLMSERVVESTVAAGGGIVFFKTEWDLIYGLPSAPDSLPLVANPFTGTDGG